MDKEDALIHNEAHFDHDVEKGASCAIPWLDLDLDMLRQFAAGQLDPVPDLLAKRTNLRGIDLSDVEGKDVLCLGAGGGQQSVIFGLLGAQVTVLELSQRQLDNDRKAADHYGYTISAIHADMQNPPGLADESVDIVYTPCTMYIPDVRRLYTECARILRHNGLLTMGFNEPSNQHMYLSGLNSEDPYEPSQGDAIEYIHYMEDIFNGLLDAGLLLQRVIDTPYGYERSPTVPVGTLDPELKPGYFTVVATKR